MTNLLSLPYELMQDIGRELGPWKKQLRLVCIRLRDALDPLVLSCIIINVTQPQLEKSLTQLRLIACKDTRPAQYIRELSIRSLAPGHKPDTRGAQMIFMDGTWTSYRKQDSGPRVKDLEAEMRHYLQAAIAKMVNLRVVRWNITRADSKWTQTAVINGLSNLKYLNHFNLHLSFGSDASELRLDHLHDLKRIVISGYCEQFHEYIVKRLGCCVARSPELAHIDIDAQLCSDNSDIPTLHSLLGNASRLPLKHLGLHSWNARFDAVTLPHFCSLTSLSLFNNIDIHQTSGSCFSTIEDFWPILQKSEVRLERLSTDYMGTSLVEYLASYSGLHQLCLRNIDKRTSDQLASIFYDSALGQHSTTLENLQVLPFYEGRWCFGEHNALMLSRCSRLRYLKLAVVSSDILPQNGLRTDTIAFLINNAARYLQSLKLLSISTVGKEALRGARSLASAQHLVFARNQIDRAIMAYTPDPEYQHHLPTITVNALWYTPREECGTGGSKSVLRYQPHERMQ